jgi:hypothetical protein
MALTPQVYQPGDLLLFSGRGFISRAVKGFTCCPCHWFRPSWRCVSHVGILADWYGKTLLIESTTLVDEPCEITGKVNKGMQAHFPKPRIAGDSGYVFLAKPNIDRMGFTARHSGSLRRFLVRALGAQYDELGAIESALFPTNADLSRVFCSEVVAGALMDIGRLPLDNPGVYTPTRLIRELVRIGTYMTPVRVK